MTRALFLGTALAAIALAAGTPPRILLWPNGAPGAKGTEPADKPALTVYLPAAEKATGTGVLVCPGGGYAHLAMDHEGKQIAAWLNELGVAAFVLEYRLAPRYGHPAPIQDATRAMRLIRAGASGYGVRPDRIGVWGFSAGGHLASTLGTHYDRGDTASSDNVARQSSRPDFLILSYAVISLTEPWTHQGSKKNLIGKDPDPALAEDLSNEKRVTGDTPPAFLFHTDGDSGVPSENSVMFYLALRRAGVPAEMHIYERGKHGVGLAPGDEVLSSWPGRLAAWLKVHGWLSRAA